MPTGSCTAVVPSAGMPIAVWAHGTISDEKFEVSGNQTSICREYFLGGAIKVWTDNLMTPGRYIYIRDDETFQSLRRTVNAMYDTFFHTWRHLDDMRISGQIREAEEDQEHVAGAKAVCQAYNCLQKQLHGMQVVLNNIFRGRNDFGEQCWLDTSDYSPTELRSYNQSLNHESLAMASAPGIKLPSEKEPAPITFTQRIGLELALEEVEQSKTTKF